MSKETAMSDCGQPTARVDHVVTLAGALGFMGPKTKHCGESATPTAPRGALQIEMLRNGGRH